MRFSVIIPTYNRANLIMQSLNSLVSQTFKDFEVIICDNGSTDNTSEIVSQYQNQLCLTYIRLNGSGQPAHPRNRGIQVAKGEWICLLDSDDWWTPNKLEIVSNYLENADLVYHPLIKTDGQKKLGAVGTRLHFKNWEGFLIYGNCIPNSSVAFRASLIEKVGFIDESSELTTVEDADFWLRIMRCGGRLRFVPQQLGYYYWKSGVNLSVINDNYLYYHQSLLQKHERFLDQTCLKAARSSLILRHCQVYFKNKRWREMRTIPLSAILALTGFKAKLQMATGYLIGRFMAAVDRITNGSTREPS